MTINNRRKIRNFIDNVEIKQYTLKQRMSPWELKSTLRLLKNKTNILKLIGCSESSAQREIYSSKHLQSK